MRLYIIVNRTGRSVIDIQRAFRQFDETCNAKTAFTAPLTD